MPRLVLFALAESTSGDDRTGRLSLFHLLEHAASPRLPAVVPWIDIVSLWHRVESDGDATFHQLVELFRPDGKRVLEHVHPFAMTKFSRRVVTRVLGIPLDAYGIWTCRLKLRQPSQEWQPAAEYDFEVIEKDPATTG